MRRRTLVSALLAVLLAGCSGQPTTPSSTPSAPTTQATPATSTSAAPFALADLPRIDGSTANIPLISLAIQRLTRIPQTEADNAVKTTGTSSAYRHLVDGETDLLVVYEADQGAKDYIKESGVKLESHPIGRDALVFFTNDANPVTSLSTAQYRSIYSGKTSTWASVGGRKAKIVAYQRPESSGSQALMRKYVMGKAPMMKAPSELVTAEMGDIIKGVASYSNSGNALGYSVYYYLANMYAVQGIKMLGAQGVVPSKATISDGSYPYTNDFFVVIRADAPSDSPARTVMAWLLSAPGQQAVADAGYVPITR